MHVATAAIVTWATSLPVSAADQVPSPRPAAPLWSGFYAGAHVGAAGGTASFSDPFGPSLFGDNVTTPAFLAGLQLGYNWRLAPRWVAGIEADASYLDGDGTYTCLQSSVTLIGSNCSVKPRALATLTGRLGYLVDPAGRTLVYGKGGLAWSASDVSISPGNAFLSYNNPAVPLTGEPLLQGDATSLASRAWGWTIGAGVEHALSPAWSLKAEYGYHRFQGRHIATPATSDITVDGVVTQIGSSTAKVTQDLHVFKLGVNYHFGHDPASAWGDTAAAIPVKAPAPAVLPGWEFEGGVRYWYSSGRSQNENEAAPGVVLSRLTYGRMPAHSGELFGRIDMPQNIFVKGFIGLGSITGGTHNDEDWGLDAGLPGVPAPTAYEVTQSDLSGSLKYATADLGFNLLRNPDGKIGVFVGYNTFESTMNAFGCSQMVQPLSGICSPPMSSGTFTLTQNDRWQSLRLGVAAEARVFDRFTISGDVAYLPYAQFRGQDTHRLRQPVAYFPQEGRGRGVQAELILSYQATENFSLGIGGRYWAVWSTDATQSCSGGCGFDPATQLPITSSPPGVYKTNAERYGMFVQGAYRFGAR